MMSDAWCVMSDAWCERGKGKGEGGNIKHNEIDQNLE